MSRVDDPAHVSFQAVSASTALAKSDVGILPGLTNVMDMLLAGSLSQGEIGPKPPFAAYTVPDWDRSLSVKIEMYLPNTTIMQSSITLGTIFSWPRAAWAPRRSSTARASCWSAWARARRLRRAGSGTRSPTRW